MIYIYISANVFDVLLLVKYLIKMVKGRRKGREGEREEAKLKRKKEKGGVGRKGEKEEDKGEDVRGGRRERR